MKPTKTHTKCSEDCTCDNCCKARKSRGPVSIISRTICGLIFIAAAVLVILNVFGAITLSINIGILVAIAALAIVAVYSAFHLFWAGLFFLAAAIITIMNANGLVFSLDGQAIGNLFIAAALLTVALHIIFRKKIFPHSDNADANFGTAVKYFEDELDTASLDCNFGQVKAYFENSTPKNGEATVNIDCNFGEIELYVPKTWRLIDKTRSSFSGTKETNRPTAGKDSPVLTLIGELNFSGLVITYV